MIAKRQDTREFKELWVAPRNLHKRILQMIQKEMEIQKGGGEGRIAAKMNALTDPDIIQALYEASNAGVKIDLLVRGTCCLRPGIPRLSENIRVISIVDRFLEHSRIYYFRAGGKDETYLSSADWRPRNFYRRYEIAFPVKDPALKSYLLEVILKNSMQDNVKAWKLLPGGDYERVARAPGAPEIRSQLVLESLAQKEDEETALKAPLPAG